MSYLEIFKNIMNLRQKACAATVLFQHSLLTWSLFFDNVSVDSECCVGKLELLRKNDHNNGGGIGHINAEE